VSRKILFTGFPDEFAERAEAYLHTRFAGARFDRRGGELWVEAEPSLLKAIVADFADWQRRDFRMARMRAGTLCDYGSEEYFSGTWPGRALDEADRLADSVVAEQMRRCQVAGVSLVATAHGKDGHSLIQRMQWR
jgi:hypothetical protein